MSWRALVYVYLLGGLTFIPLLVCVLIGITIYTSVPVARQSKPHTRSSNQHHPDGTPSTAPPEKDAVERPADHDTDDFPKTHEGWLTVRRTFEESEPDGSYMTLVKSYLDARSKVPRRSRLKDMWYVVLKGTVLYLYEDDAMVDCGVAIQLSSHQVSVYPEGLADGELFTRRNAICLTPKASAVDDEGLDTDDTVAEDGEETADGNANGNGNGNGSKKRRSKERGLIQSAPWFIFVRSCVEMEDWYLALVHASDHPAFTPTLKPLHRVFLPSEMSHLVATLDDHPDEIPVRWLNALLGRLFFSFYKTETLEASIMARLMKKLSKVKRPAFLTEIAITRVAVGNKVPMLSKPMLKELTKEGDASLEIGVSFKGEIRITVEATAVINLGARFKPYAVKLVVAVVLRELEGNLLIKVKRPPSSRIWYAFTKAPRLVLNVEPIVSDRQITWSMILNTIESKLGEIIADSVVMPNMDDISFWDSSPYTHRGGLWSDAARSDKPMSPLPHEEKPPASGSSVASDGKRPAEAEEQIFGTAPPGEALRAVSATSSPDDSSKRARRRSWFSVGDGLDGGGVRDDDVASASRGRKNRTGSIDQKTGGNMTNLFANNAMPAMVGEQDDVEHLSLRYSPRSSSVHSQTRSSRPQSVSSSPGDEANCLSESSAMSVSTSTATPVLPPASPRSLTDVSTTSLLSTLRLDKQKLGDTVREAMRKWGDNLTTLRKDMKRGAPQEELPDAGPMEDRARIEGVRHRANYADVRASVAMRKQASETERRASSPVPIPRQESRSSSGHVSSSPGSAVAGGDAHAAARLSRSLGDEGTGSYDRDFRYDGDERVEAPVIYTQPSEVRTMTIPAVQSDDGPEDFPSESKTTISRLWRSRTVSGQSQLPKAQANTQPEETRAPAAPLASTVVASKPVPPPLPPRSMTTTTVLVKGGSTSSDGSVLPASNGEIAVEVEGGTPGPEPEPGAVRQPGMKPPLPPRRSR